MNEEFVAFKNYSDSLIKGYEHTAWLKNVSVII